MSQQYQVVVNLPLHQLGSKIGKQGISQILLNSVRSGADSVVLRCWISRVRVYCYFCCLYGNGTLKVTVTVKLESNRNQLELSMSNFKLRNNICSFINNLM